MKLNWAAWLYGLGSGFIGGGAGAFGAGFGGLMTDPEHFNPANGPRHILVLMGYTFLFSGLITAFAYLKQSPLPAVETTTTVSMSKTTTVSATKDVAPPAS
jgi:hypothetical protein